MANDDYFAHHRMIFEGEDEVLKYLNTSDTRYILIHQPAVPLSLIAIYVCFCVWIGPYLMKNRAPLKLNKLIFIYDFLLVIINAYLGVIFAMFSFRLDWSFHCPLHVESWIKNMLVANHKVVFYVYITKFVEFMDTVFFVLTKKQRNISFLHIFHHSAVPLGCWLVFMYDPTAFYWATVVALNLLTHVLMYAYYGLAAAGYKGILRYKKYMTSVQIGQFMIQLTYMLFLNYNGCIRYGNGLVVGCLIMFSFWILFLNFYRQNFLEKKQLKCE